MNSDTFWRRFARAMRVRERPAPQGSSKPRPNVPERYNAQPYEGPPFSREEAEAVARKRATRFARWMKSQAKFGGTPPRHIRGD